MHEMVTFKDIRLNLSNYEFSVSLNLSRNFTNLQNFIACHGLLALWACVEHRLPFISRPSLLGGVCHFIITTLRTLSLNLQRH